MDYEGFRRLMDEEMDEFLALEGRLKEMPAPQLLENHNKWHGKLIEALQEYVGNEESKSPAEFGAKMSYLFYLAVFGLLTLREYTMRLGYERSEVVEILKKLAEEKKEESRKDKTSKKRKKKRG